MAEIKWVKNSQLGGARMRIMKFLVVFLLFVSLVLVPVVCYGKIGIWWVESQVLQIDVHLLKARIDYVMHNPTNYSEVCLRYNQVSVKPEGLPNYVDVLGKVVVTVYDNRGQFSHKSGVVLLDEFKRKLEVIYSFINYIATNMDEDVVAVFYSEGGIPLGYFYQGKYYLLQE